jgi:uncharacterized membrane protein YdfJ with MMPL/SSD domain
MREVKGWRAASHEVAELVRTAGPRIALAGAVVFVMAAAPVLLRFWVFVPGWTS